MSAILKDLPVSSQLQQHIADAVKEAIEKRIPTLAAVGLVPPRYVRLEVAELLTGYTVRAMNHKIDDGVWLEGNVWRQAPDGRRLLDLRGFEDWVESGRPGDKETK